MHRSPEIHANDLTKVISAFVCNLARGRAFWLLLLGYALCLSWWRWAIPWSSGAHAQHAHSHAHETPAWLFASTWPMIVVWVFLIQSLFPSPLVSSHPLASRQFETPRGQLLSWSALRLLTETFSCLIAATILQHLLAACLGWFHVEPWHWLANSLFTVSAVCACAAVRLTIRLPVLRLFLLLPLLLIPAYLRQTHEGGELEIALGSVIFTAGLLTLGDNRRRIDAIRSLR